jgi:hypothetical protein
MDWNWWIHSTAGLLARIGIGAAIFAGLAIWDLWRRGSQATRWREYLFLVACVAAALLYGVINDQLTTTISWEYFAYGKGVSDVLPAREPPNSLRFRWEAALIGMKATWTAGLVIGVALLIANNPRRGRARLREAELIALLPMVLLVTATTAMLAGLAGFVGLLLPFSSDFRQLVADDMFRPRRFMAVFGVHLGGYIGGVLGTVTAVVRLLRTRRKRAADDALRPPPA